MIIRKALPALSGDQLTYDAELNLYHTSGYTSASGNSYFKLVRVSERLVVYCELGVGYARTFLNGITIFGFDGREAHVIGRRSFGGYDNWCSYNDHNVTQACIEIVKDYLLAQAKLMGARTDERQMLQCAQALIEETKRKQIA